MEFMTTVTVSSAGTSTQQNPTTTANSPATILNQNQVHTAITDNNHTNSNSNSNSNSNGNGNGNSQMKNNGGGGNSECSAGHSNTNSIAYIHGGNSSSSSSSSSLGGSMNGSNSNQTHMHEDNLVQGQTFNSLTSLSPFAQLTANSIQQQPTTMQRTQLQLQHEAEPKQQQQQQQHHHNHHHHHHLQQQINNTQSVNPMIYNNKNASQSATIYANQSLDKFVIYENFHVHDVHRIEDGICTQLTRLPPKKQGLLKQFGIHNNQTVTYYEKFLIMENFSRFCNEYKVVDHRPFLELQERGLPKSEQLKFVRYLGQGLPNLTLNKIYLAFKDVLGFNRIEKMITDGYNLETLLKRKKKNLLSRISITAASKDNTVVEPRSLLNTTIAKTSQLMPTPAITYQTLRQPQPQSQPQLQIQAQQQQQQLPPQLLPLSLPLTLQQPHPQYAGEIFNT